MCGTAVLQLLPPYDRNRRTADKLCCIMVVIRVTAAVCRSCFVWVFYCTLSFCFYTSACIKFSKFIIIFYFNYIFLINNLTAYSELMAVFVCVANLAYDTIQLEYFQSSKLMNEWKKKNDLMFISVISSN